MKEFDDLINVVRKLRAPEGCPWDREQTRESLIPYFIEEVHEAVDTIERNEIDKLKYELGDVLLHVVFQTVIAEENNEFSFQDVLKTIHDKMISRHPHVFQKDREYTPEEANQIWEQEKSREKREHILDGIPQTLPALHRSYRMQQKAAAVGFDWDNVDDVWKKLDEELAEFKHALASHDTDEIENEFGDILFVLVNLSRFYNIHPETALKRSNEKFYRRFNAVEDHYKQQNRSMQEAGLEELDAVWNKIKQDEKK
ncbi:MAG: nucleoside triphosphate pyrophosphohydrolase [Candidatus Marinimicrobia bacterium]|nr:nucleoside triphosphate pyrophosphohydrolase [Candidatus Neomarinimicrobiota bacterium]